MWREVYKCGYEKPREEDLQKSSGGILHNLQALKNHEFSVVLRRIKVDIMEKWEEGN